MELDREKAPPQAASYDEAAGGGRQQRPLGELPQPAETTGLPGTLRNLTKSRRGEVDLVSPEGARQPGSTPSRADGQPVPRGLPADTLNWRNSAPTNPPPPPPPCPTHALLRPYTARPPWPPMRLAPPRPAHRLGGRGGSGPRRPGPARSRRPLALVIPSGHHTAARAHARADNRPRPLAAPRHLPPPARPAAWLPVRVHALACPHSLSLAPSPSPRPPLPLPLPLPSLPEPPTPISGLPLGLGLGHQLYLGPRAAGAYVRPGHQVYPEPWAAVASVRPGHQVYPRRLGRPRARGAAGRPARPLARAKRPAVPGPRPRRREGRAAPRRAAPRPTTRRGGTPFPTAAHRPLPGARDTRSTPAPGDSSERDPAPHRTARPARAAGRPAGGDPPPPPPPSKARAPKPPPRVSGLRPARREVEAARPGGASLSLPPGGAPLPGARAPGRWLSFSPAARGPSLGARPPHPAYRAWDPRGGEREGGPRWPGRPARPAPPEPPRRVPHDHAVRDGGEAAPHPSAPPAPNHERRSSPGPPADGRAAGYREPTEAPAALRYRYV
ncbi:basic proline-rich protein-like [Ammospiza nelsoni]|uniref:basic proline-rich protein-like n=1 Tax=Ammospiza nelsoni TaxID=2857394 RepID=UPI002869C6BA|nr:basic proline-rich protein-like [Ammospiza nelsoni]